MSSYQVAAITAAVAKANQGFIAANQRQGCNTCQHGKELREDRMPPYDTASWQCKFGGFRTTAKAICNQHKPQKENSQ